MYVYVFENNRAHLNFQVSVESALKSSHPIVCLFTHTAVNALKMDSASIYSFFQMPLSHNFKSENLFKFSH